MSIEEAKAAVVCEPIEYGSADGHTRIHGLCWQSTSQPKGLVQIVHGMVEHIARYDDFARFLAVNGYTVCGNDHIGHGKTAGSFENLSKLPVNGSQVMTSDVHTLRTIMQKTFDTDTPYFLFGHSMGSFILRTYMARYATGLAGTVLSGTGHPSLATARFGSGLARWQAQRKGPDAVSTFLNSLADGAYSKKIKNARTPFDWLNTDPEQVDTYINDPLCGKMFSIGGYVSLMDLISEAVSAECAAAVPDNLPVLFIAGEQDPVGNNGAGVKAAAEAISTRAKAQVRTIIYSDMRHEILLEPNRQRVYDDVLKWFDEIVQRYGAPQAVESSETTKE